MQYEERLRETHRPDWWPIVLGVTSTFAVMGALSVVGMAMSMLTIYPDNSVPLIVAKCLWLIGSVIISGYLGGFVTGLVLKERGRVPAAMDAILVWEATVVIFAVVGWFGFSPLPGVTFSTATSGYATEGIAWMAMMFGLPIPFAFIYGAMHGNDRGHEVTSPIGGEENIPQNRAA